MSADRSLPAGGMRSTAHTFRMLLKNRAYHSTSSVILPSNQLLFSLGLTSRSVLQADTPTSTPVLRTTLSTRQTPPAAPTGDSALEPAGGQRVGSGRRTPAVWRDLMFARGPAGGRGRGCGT